MSRSRTVSRIRRAEPASETSTEASCSCSTCTTARSFGSVVPRSARCGPSAARGRASASAIFCSVPGPMPACPRSSCASAAALSASTVVIPSSCQIRRAVFGPSPGRRMNVATSAGTSAFRFVSAWISPSSTTSTIFASIVLPMSCSAFALPSSASCATDDGVSRIRAAALRYALMRKRSAPSSSIRSPSSSNCSASCSFRGNSAMQAIIGADMRATVCLPTYNECDNLEPMLEALQAVLRDGDRVLVIDDNSPDGTGEIADRLAASLPFVSVLHRERKEGLGPAYLAGFRRALEEGAELVLEMDCDFSHDPADVPRLVAAVEGGADLALGSRYVPGGRVGNWGLIRRAISRGGSVYTAVWLRMGVKDPTGGVKGVCRRGVEGVAGGAGTG